MKPNKRLCTAIEKKLAYDQKFSHYLPDEFIVEEEDNRKNDFFKQYGFRTSNYVNDLYFRYNGIKSDKYIPSDLYLFYIFPSLVSREMMFAYIDKNNYEMLFPNIAQPKVIVRNQNGYYSYGLEGGFKLLTQNEAIDVLSNYSSFIIKPSNDTGGGKGVRKVTVQNGMTNKGETLEELFKSYIQDFVVQEVVEQYEPFNQLNRNSLNTMRIITYRRNGNEFVFLGAFIRFGVNGAEVDNMGMGGLACKVASDGLIEDRVYYTRHFKLGSLKELFGIEQLYVPNFQSVLDFCYNLHSQLNYFDLCGWDIAIGKDGEPVFIELNQYPDCESFQITNGPMFGEYTDEIMEKVSKNKTQFTLSIRREFDEHRKAEFWLADI